MAEPKRLPNGRWRIRYRDPLGRPRSKVCDTKAEARDYVQDVGRTKGWVATSLGRITRREWAAQYMSTVVYLRPTTFWLYERELAYILTGLAVQAVMKLGGGSRCEDPCAAANLSLMLANNPNHFGGHHFGGHHFGGQWPGASRPVGRGGGSVVESRNNSARVGVATIRIATCAAMCALVTGLSAAVPASAGPLARQVRSATHTYVTLQSVSAVPGTHHAIAVGLKASSIGHSYSSSDLIEWWTGSKWQPMTAPPLPSGVTSGDLSGVFAASANDAWAVGGDSAGLQLLHYNGTSWSAVSVPGLPNNASLSAIGGSSNSDIWAVGSSYTSSLAPLELQYDATTQSWSVEQEPSGEPMSLSDVSVVSSNLAWAVGYNSATNSSVVLKYNGSSWAPVSTGAPRPTSLSGVSAKGNGVWVVGFKAAKDSDSAFAMSYNGSSWKAVTVPVPKGRNPTLGQVADFGGTAFAIGSVDTTTGIAPFFEKLSKGRWTESSVPAAPANSSLLGLGGSGPTNVWAVGDYWTGGLCTSNTSPLAYHYVTSWKGTSALSLQLATTAQGGSATPHC